MEMARRRKLDENSIQNLQADGAIAESFGYYFSEDGEVVHKMLTSGCGLRILCGQRRSSALLGSRQG